MGVETIVKLREVYGMLQDEQSRDIYMNRLNYLVSGEFRYMRYIIDKYLPELSARNNNRILDLYEHLPKDKPFVLYGAGEDAETVLHYFEKDDRFRGFCDRNVDKQKSGAWGHPVISPEELLAGDRDIGVVICTHRFYKEIKDFLIDNGFDKDRICYIWSYVSGGNEGQYFNPDFMYFEEEEVFIDAGSKDLGTVKALSRYAKRIKKAYAFEPDPYNYEGCLKNKAWFEDGTVEVIPCGTWSGKEKLYFSATADGGSHIEDQGEVCVDVTAIDEVVDAAERVTFIKMDVEGSELESLKGARNVIQRDKPKLAISIYHKPEDMLTIPLYIKSLVPEYRLYVRHHSSRMYETVLYAMP